MKYVYIYTHTHSLLMNSDIFVLKLSAVVVVPSLVHSLDSRERYQPNIDILLSPKCHNPILPFSYPHTLILILSI